MIDSPTGPVERNPLTRRVLVALHAAIGAAALAMTLSCVAAEAFNLREQRVQAPEMGVILTYVLVAGQETYSFVPPWQWRVEVEAEHHRVIFRCPQNSATICLAVQNLNPALESGAKPSLLREEVQHRFSDAMIREEFPCYTSSHSGRGFQVEWGLKSQAPMISRLAIFGTTRSTLEFTLTAPAHVARTVQPILGSLLTSFQSKTPNTAHPP